MDEIQLTKRIFYDKKSDLIGYGTFGKSLGQVASKALVIMLRSINFQWEQIVGYHFTGSLLGKDIKQLITTSIEDIYLQTGFQVEQLIIRNFL